jgi:hypothetical protein
MAAAPSTAEMAVRSPSASITVLERLARTLGVDPCELIRAVKVGPGVKASMASCAEGDAVKNWPRRSSLTFA